MRTNAIFLFACQILLLMGGYARGQQSGETVEVGTEFTTPAGGTAGAKGIGENVSHWPDGLVQPYNILETKPLPACPEGYILANRRCHKRVKRMRN